MSSPARPTGTRAPQVKWPELRRRAKALDFLEVECSSRSKQLIYDVIDRAGAPVFRGPAPVVAAWLDGVAHGRAELCQCDAIPRDASGRR